MSETARREVVLVGAGHAHVQVLDLFAAAPPPGAVLTVVTDTPRAAYSGMVPGHVEGRYRAEELTIDVRPLAERAGARLILSRAVGVDPSRRRIDLENGADVRYDVASFDIGSTVAGLERPGVREHAWPTRPIGRFVERCEAVFSRAREGGGPERVVVVGGGAGGVELLFTLVERLRREGVRSVRGLLVEAGPRILRGHPASLVRRVAKLAETRGVAIRCGGRVSAVGPRAVQLDDGDRLPFDLLVWVTGAWGQPVFEHPDLRTDERRFLLVRATLQAVGHDDLFAAGDCATLIDHPETPKAGVHAVRQGPLLAGNLRALLAGRPLRSYRPQRDFLTLLNVGGGIAFGAKWGLSFGGRWVMALKDRIDRRFVRRYNPEGGGLTPGGPPPPRTT